MFKSVILILHLFGSNKTIYIKAEAIMAVYDVECVDQKTEQLVTSDQPCAVITVIGEEYEVVGTTAAKIAQLAFRGKK
jgi:hypothetical protein